MVIPLTPEQIVSLFLEIKSAEHRFGDHYLGIYKEMQATDGPLRFGKSIWMHVADHTTPFIHPELFPETIKLIKEVAENLNKPMIGRVYIHRLAMGEEIRPHRDVEPYFNDVTRYHIYLHIPKDVIINFATEVHPYTIMEFDASQTHEYINNSEKDFLFIIFDLYDA